MHILLLARWKMFHAFWQSGISFYNHRYGMKMDMHLPEMRDCLDILVNRDPIPGLVNEVHVASPAVTLGVLRSWTASLEK